MPDLAYNECKFVKHRLLLVYATASCQGSCQSVAAALLVSAGDAAERVNQTGETSLASPGFGSLLLECET